MKNKRTIFVTGATGFIGRRLIKRLRGEKNPLYLTALKEDKDLGVEKLNLLDFEALKKAVKRIKPDIVYHLGAFSDLSRDYQTAKDCVKININSTLDLLEALRFSVPKKLIFTSTEEVYGDNHLPFKEDQIPRPPSAYSISKIASENLCRMYANELGFSLVILRIGTCYGPEQPLTKFIAQLIIKALENENLPLNSGLKKRDYAYIDDVVTALISAQEKKLKNQSEVINIGGQASYQLKELAELIIRLTKSKSKILTGAFPDRTGEANEWFMDSGKAKKLLGWQPKTGLKEGLQLAVDFYREAIKLNLKY